MIDEKMLNLGVAGLLAIVIMQLVRLVTDMMRMRNGSAPPTKTDLEQLGATISAAMIGYTDRIEKSYDPKAYEQNVRLIEATHSKVEDIHMETVVIPRRARQAQ